ncbi:ABC transporter substrate-binding protein [Paenibacillus sp. PK3_47]|uniref:ABC transporter substrate-binding protein n=1 Tax=Paenibacillus sp. PK3_47 TaxID=2072642 RepID=UPI00201DF6DF|nr:ABC transporter substrate-binding protein [Paenibacillus sp. PK3_47]
MKIKWLLIPMVCMLMVIIWGCSSESSNLNPAATSSMQQDNNSSTDNESAANAVNNDFPQELIIVDQEIAASVDPVAPLTSSYLVALAAGEPLFKVDANGIVQPLLAEGAEAIDSTTWEISLKENAQFWSGKAVDAEAVIASLERSRDLDKQVIPYIQDLTFTPVDTYTIHVKTAREHMDVPLNLSYYQTLIHNAEASFDSVETMDLTGMYKVVAFEPQKRMELEINDNYWGRKPTIPRIVQEQISDEQTRMLSVLSGNSHIAHKMPVSGISQLQGSDEVRISAVPAANTQTIYLNLSQSKFQDVRVRQALSWGIDRDELIVQAAEGQSIPLTTWMSSNPAFSEARNAVYTQYDAERAGQLLDEAGWLLSDSGVRMKDGEPLTINLMTWGGDSALGETLQFQWTKLGIQANVQHGDYNLIEVARENGEWDAFIEAWSTFGDPLTLMKGQFSPSGSGNYGGFDDELTNDLLEQLALANDEATRRELALEINAHVAEQAPVVSLFPRPQITAVSQKLEGFVDHFRQFENLVNENLTFVSP